jgi:hypothetical protein
MNKRQYTSTTIHHIEHAAHKVRKKPTCISRMYTIDYFPNYSYIHQWASPSIFGK